MDINFFKEFRKNLNMRQKEFAALNEDSVKFRMKSKKKLTK